MVIDFTRERLIYDQKYPLFGGGMKKYLVIMTILLWTASANATNWYVDNAATGANNGASWADAWTSIAGIKGLKAGDTVYFSGGLLGKTYTVNNWTPAGGTAENPITYAAGQDAGHTGMVTFSGSGNFLDGNTNNLTLNGNVNGSRNMTIASSYSWTVFNDTTADHHVRLLYLNFTAPIWARGGYWELGFSSGKSPLSTLDDSYIAHLGDGGTAGFGISSIHHNIIQVNRKKTSGQGQDALKWVGNVDIYNNTFLSVFNASYTGTQHDDGIQTDGHYVRVYNNYFENFISYPIYNEMYGDTSHWRIYNNVIKAEESGVDWSAYQCMALGFSATGTISDYIVANNTCIGGPNRRGIHLNTGVPGTIGSNVYIVNNLVYNSDTTVLWNGPGSPTAVSNNVGGTSGLAFVSNTLYPTADFRLTALAIAAVDRGISPSYLTSVYTTDKEDVSRMLKPTWDIGAYVSGVIGTAPLNAPQNLKVN